MSEETQSAAERVIEMAREITPAKTSRKFELAAWPFSRFLVTAICTSQGIPLVIERISKQKEEFTVDADENFEVKVKEMIKIINKEARASGENFSENRNEIIAVIWTELVGEETEEEVADGEEGETEGDGYDDLTVPQLKELAKENSIKADKAWKKEDFIAALRALNEPVDEEEDREEVAESSEEWGEEEETSEETEEEGNDL